MPIAKEVKDGVMNNLSICLNTAVQMIQQNLKCREGSKKITEHDQQLMLIDSICNLTTAIASIGQALVMDIETRSILLPHEQSERRN